MENRLYRIKTLAIFEEPEIKGKVTLFLDGGILFADVKPVKIKAKPNVEEAACCKSEFKDEWYDYIYRCLKCGMHFMADEPRYCPNCGRRFVTSCD